MGTGGLPYSSFLSSSFVLSRYDLIFKEGLEYEIQVTSQPLVNSYQLVDITNIVVPYVKLTSNEVKNILEVIL